jgi:hypothetical protein
MRECLMHLVKSWLHSWLHPIHQSSSVHFKIGEKYQSSHIALHHVHSFPFISTLPA